MSVSSACSTATCSSQGAAAKRGRRAMTSLFSMRIRCNSPHAASNTKHFVASISIVSFHYTSPSAVSPTARVHAVPSSTTPAHCSYVPPLALASRSMDRASFSRSTCTNGVAPSARCTQQPSVQSYASRPQPPPTFKYAGMFAGSP